MHQYLELLKTNRNFRYLWLGSVVSQAGDWFNLVASATLIASLTNSGAAISLLFLVRFVPLFVFSPLAGVLADRFSRRKLMIISDVVRAFTVLGFLLVRTADDVWILYLLTVIQFAFSALFTPARTALISNVVEREELVTANALDSFTWSTMLAVGALLGGVVAALFGFRTAFVLDALTFGGSALLIAQIVVAGGTKPATPASPTHWAEPMLEFMEGLRYLRLHRFVLGIALVKGAGALAWGAINVLEIIYAKTIFPLGEDGSTTLALIYFATGLGTGFGPLILRRWLGDGSVRMRWAITLGFALMSLGLWWLALAPTLALYLVGTVVRTVGSGAMWVFSAALLQTIVPNRVRGRVFGIEFALLTLTQSISIVWAGYAKDALGLSASQIAMSMALLSMVAGLLWLSFHLHFLRRPAQEALSP